MTQRIRALKRQLNEAEEETARKEAQYRHAQRELGEEREAASRLQRQLLEQHLQMKLEQLDNNNNAQPGQHNNTFRTTLTTGPAPPDDENTQQ